MTEKEKMYHSYFESALMHESRPDYVKENVEKNEDHIKEEFEEWYEQNFDENKL